MRFVCRLQDYCIESTRGRTHARGHLHSGVKGGSEERMEKEAGVTSRRGTASTTHRAMLPSPNGEEQRTGREGERKDGVTMHISICDIIYDETRNQVHVHP